MQIAYLGIILNPRFCEIAIIYTIVREGSNRFHAGWVYWIDLKAAVAETKQLLCLQIASALIAISLSFYGMFNL